MIIRKFNIGPPAITQLVSDNTNNFVWIAYAQSGTTCVLERVCATDFTQVYMSIPITCSAILGLYIYNNNICVLIEGGQNGLLAIQYSVFTSLSPTYIYQPYGIPTPSALVISSVNSAIYILIPSSSGGNNGYILHFNSSGVYQETIHFSSIVPFGFTLVEENSMAIDTSDNIWIVTQTSPVMLVRVWFASGGWRMEVHNVL